MTQCAICRRRDVPYSIEHVIPEALGGCYTSSHLICVDCNSQLGHRVDDPLVNHWLAKLFRFCHGLRGKANAPPNPFAGEFNLQTDPDRKMRIRIGSDGGLVPYAIPVVKRTNLDPDRVQVEISIDASDEAQLEGIVSKIAKRAGLSAEEILDAERTRVSNDNGLVGQRVIDTRNFKIGLLKIAYAFACERVLGYVQSSDAGRVAEVLREARLEEVERYANIGDGFDHAILAPFADFLDFEGLKHYLVLCATGDRLLCFVHLHQLFTVGVTLSTESFGEFLEFGVNDAEARTFKVWPLRDLPVVTRLRPGLYFQTPKQAKAFRKAEHSRDFDYESRNGSWKLFGPDGTDLSIDIDGLLAQLEPVRSGTDGDMLVNEYELPVGVYHLRPLASDPLPLVAIRAEHSWEKI